MRHRYPQAVPGRLQHSFLAYPVPEERHRLRGDTELAEFDEFGWGQRDIDGCLACNGGRYLLDVQADSPACASFVPSNGQGDQVARVGYREVKRRACA